MRLRGTPVHFMLTAGCGLMLAACSGGNDAPTAEKAKQEEPAEKGAAEIERKADEAVKAKVAEFEARARQQDVEASSSTPANEPDDTKKE